MTASSANHQATTPDTRSPDPSGPPPGFGLEINRYLNQHVTIADAKAVAFVAGDLVVISVLINRLPAPGTARLWFVAAIALLALATAVAAFVLFPRLPKSGHSVIFWEDIHAHSSVQHYYRALQILDKEKVEQAFAEQNYYISRVLHDKNMLVRWSIALSLLGAACGGIGFWLTQA